MSFLELVQNLTGAVSEGFTSLARALNRFDEQPPFGGLGSGGLGVDPTPLNALLRSINYADYQTGEKKAKAEAAHQKAQSLIAERAANPQGGAYASTAPNVSGFAPDQQGIAQQIIQDAMDTIGPAAGPIVAALMQQEGGLGGTVGDRSLRGAGSHGPYQFYGGPPDNPGQLNAYARAHGNVDLATAGQMVRNDPVGAARWAHQTYLGQALREGINRGLSGEALFDAALRVQNGGVFDPRYAESLGAYRNAYRQQEAAFRAPAPAAPAPAPGATSTPFQGQPYRIAFDVNQRYTTPLPGGTTHHRGVDLVPQQGGIGAPVTALQGGTVVAFAQGGAQGNAVVLQAPDGLYHAYFHLRDRNTLAPGTPVAAGQVIGAMGQSGSEGFPHLHLEVRRALNGDPRGSVIDPLAYFGLR